MCYVFIHIDLLLLRENYAKLRVWCLAYMRTVAW